MNIADYIEDIYRRQAEEVLACDAFQQLESGEAPRESRQPGAQLTARRLEGGPLSATTGARAGDAWLLCDFGWACCAWDGLCAWGGLGGVGRLGMRERWLGLN
mgnify:CR=1 FL=1